MRCADASAAPRRPGISALLNPPSVVIVGLSPRPDTYGHRALLNLRRGGFRGVVTGVHPRGEPVAGVPVYRAVSDLPASPSVAVISTPSDTVNPLLEDLGCAGCRAAIVLGSGFDETDHGVPLAATMRAIAHRYHMAVVGPNCLGVISLVHDAWITGGSPLDDLRLGHVAVISQSGSGILMMTGCGRLTFSYLISSGNETVTTLADYLDYLADDPPTRVIGAVIEGISDPGRLITAARKANANGKPVVALKVGRTRRGAERVRSHTGRIAGDPQAYDAFRRRAGLIPVQDYDAFIQTLVALSAEQVRPRGRRVAFVGLSGGEAALIADLAESAGIELAELSDNGRRRLAAVLPDFATVANPLDGTGALVRDPGRFGEVVRTLARDSAVDLTVVFLDACPQMSRDLAATYARLLDLLPGVQREVGRPLVVLSNYSGGLSETITRPLHGSSIPILQGTIPGLAAIAACLAGGTRPEVASCADRGAFDSAGLTGDSRETLRMVRRALADAPPARLPENVLQSLARAYGFCLPRRAEAASVEEATAAARRLGYPLVMKTQAPGIIHKSDIGGVITDLRSEDDIAAAYRRVVASASAHLGAPAAEVAVEKMVRGGIEAFIGARTDPAFGAILCVGLGGALVELLRDIACVLLPATASDMACAVQRTRLHQLFRGFRGAPPADADAFIALALRVGRLLQDLDDPEVEIDLNPVVVLPKGQGTSVLDLRIIRRP